jgi:hypothetical protein
MRAAALLISMFAFALTSSGCLEADIRDNILKCSGIVNRECPKGYFCAANNFCFHNGAHPVFDMTLPPSDLSMSTADDLLVPVSDLSSTD